MGGWFRGAPLVGGFNLLLLFFFLGGGMSRLGGTVGQTSRCQTYGPAFCHWQWGGGGSWGGGSQRSPQPHLLLVCLPHHLLPPLLPTAPLAGAMHSLVFLCARRLVSYCPGARRALDLLPAELYPVLFQAAFLDGRTLALRDLVGTWPFPVLSFQRLLGHRGRHSLLEEKPSKLCIQAIILAVVAHLRRVLEEPGCGTRWVPGCQTPPGWAGAVLLLLWETEVTMLVLGTSARAVVEGGSSGLAPVLFCAPATREESGTATLAPPQGWSELPDGHGSPGSRLFQFPDFPTCLFIRFLPSPSERRCRLRVLDMTGLQDDDTDRGPEGMSLWSGTVALAKACIEVSKHQSECLKRGSKRRKGPSGTSAALQPVGVEVRADLFVNGTSYGVLRDALQTGAAGPLRLKCRDFHAEELSVAGTVSLLESLEPAGVRRVDLRFNNLGLGGLCAVLPHLSRFTDLLSLKLPYSNVDVRRLTAGTDAGLRCLATQLGRLPCLKELNLGSSRLSGKLRQLLG